MARSKQQRRVADRLWELIEPLIPSLPAPRGRADARESTTAPHSKGSRSCSTPAAAREAHPEELGCGSGHTAWRRLREWQDAGVWDQLHQLVLDELPDVQLSDWSRVCIDGVSFRSKKGGELTGPNPTGRHVVGLTGPIGRPTLCPPRYSPLGLMEVEVADLAAFDRFEAVGWETTAAAYDHYWPRLTNRLNDHLLDAVGAGPHARLLDVACGPGYLAGQASDRGATVTGIDVAKAMVEMARRRCPRIEFRQADAQALPFPEASFHAIVGNLAIPHLARPERAAAEFHRVLAAKGRLALTTWDLPGRARLVGVLLEAVREVEVIPPETVPTGPDFFRFADNAEFNALLAGQGFTEVEVRSIAFMHPVGSPDELWDGLLRGTVRTSAIVRGQPDDVVARIRVGFDRRMQAYRAGRTYEIPVAFKLASGRQS